MQTECSPTLFEFEPVERHKVVAGFDGGIITSDAGGLLLGRLDRGLLIRRMASCFTDRLRLLEHTIGQRVFALALHEDLNDHDRVTTRCSMCWRGQAFGLCAGGRQEHAPAWMPRREAGKYHKIAPSLEALFRPRWPQASAEGDRARPRRHRRHDPRRARRSVLPWLLRQLLLPAALRPVRARRQAAPRQHRRGRRRGRRGRPDRARIRARSIRASAARS